MQIASAAHPTIVRHGVHVPTCAHASDMSHGAAAAAHAATSTAATSTAAMPDESKAAVGTIENGEAGR